jgi:hypothetical protein
MTRQDADWYLGQRAEALTMVLLTRREDLVIQQSRQDSGLDLVVEILRGDRPTGRVFGVQLKARTRPIVGEELPTEFRGGLVEQPFVTFPVCAFLFTMQDERGYYYWLNEPLLLDAVTPKLLHPELPRIRPLDTDSLDRIVSRVDQWYEALTTILAA